MKLRFSPIDLARDSDLCVEFRRDSYASSFENGGGIFDAENGEDGADYLSWLAERITEFPEGCVHAYLGDRIVGQLEARIRNPELGYVNLFYLVPDCRGTSLGEELHKYLELTMRSRSIKRVQLTVGTGNARAMAYYTKHGWKSLGFKDPGERVYLMELGL